MYYTLFLSPDRLLSLGARSVSCRLEPRELAWCRDGVDQVSAAVASCRAPGVRWRQEYPALRAAGSVSRIRADNVWDLRAARLGDVKSGWRAQKQRYNWHDDD